MMKTVDFFFILKPTRKIYSAMRICSPQIIDCDFAGHVVQSKANLQQMSKTEESNFTPATLTFNS